MYLLAFLPSVQERISYLPCLHVVCPCLGLFVVLFFLPWTDRRSGSSLVVLVGKALPSSFTMDDYMKEMMDLKALVTKTLEKKGVMARIRAELRANIFQAIEEQDHVTEREGGENFALLGQCNERAKQLHSTPAGKLLTGLLCEYLEWCKLDRTMDVYLPELNQEKPYSRFELEELLEIKNDKNGASGSTESRPLLLEVLEGYLKYETTLVKESHAIPSSTLARSSKTSSNALMNGVDIGDEELNGALESRLNLSK